MCKFSLAPKKQYNIITILIQRNSSCVMLKEADEALEIPQAWK